jgi:hypothetical protein
MAWGETKFFYAPRGNLWRHVHEVKMVALAQPALQLFEMNDSGRKSLAFAASKVLLK